MENSAPAIDDLANANFITEEVAISVDTVKAIARIDPIDNFSQCIICRYWIHGELGGSEYLHSESCAWRRCRQILRRSDDQRTSSFGP